MHSTRKPERSLTEETARQILKEADYGVLSMITSDGPYATPVNYVYDGKDIYFHGALQGWRYESLLKNDKVCLCVVTDHTVLPDQLSTAYRSVLVFGRCRAIEDKSYGLQQIMKKFVPEGTKIFHSTDSCFNQVAIYKIEIDHITGKHRPVHKEDMEKEA